jgi:hypothetical protein
MRISLCAILVSALVTATTTDAAVLCRRKSGAVLVRDASCKKKETALDLSTFGALGPKGDKGDQGDQGLAGPGAVTRSGAINADGSPQDISAGTTSTRIGTGQYRISFAAGTWTGPFTVVFSGLGSAVTGQWTTANPDGSGQVEVDFTGDTVFLFIGVQTD